MASCPQLEKTKQQCTQVPCVWSPAYAGLSVQHPDSFPSQHHSHFSLFSVNTGTFRPLRDLLRTEVQTHLYFFSSSFIRRYVSLQNQLGSGSPWSTHYLWNHPFTFNLWTSMGSHSSSNQAQVSPLTSTLFVSASLILSLYHRPTSFLHTAKLLGIIFVISSSLVLTMVPFQKPLHSVRHLLSPHSWIADNLRSIANFAWVFFFFNHMVLLFIYFLKS